MSTLSITLGDASYEIKPIPLGRMKKLLPALNRVTKNLSAEDITEDGLNDALLCISLALNMPLEEVEGICADFDQFMGAIPIIINATNAQPKAAQPGETTAES